MATYDDTVDNAADNQFAVPSFDYQIQLETAAPTITQKISDLQAPGESWMDTLSRSLPILAATYQQKQILSVQVDRARQGLPPLDASQYAAGVQIGLSSDTKKLLIYGAVGLGALLLIMRK